MSASARQAASVPQGYSVWYAGPERSYPWRWCRSALVDKGLPGQNHGGALTKADACAAVIEHAERLESGNGNL